MDKTYLQHNSTRQTAGRPEADKHLHWKIQEQRLVQVGLESTLIYNATQYTINMDKTYLQHSSTRQAADRQQTD